MEENPRMPLIETKEDEYFFRLMMAKSRIKELGTEIGKLQSEIEELKFELKKLQAKEKLSSTIEKRTTQEKRNYNIMQEVISQLISKNNNNIKVENFEEFLTSCALSAKKKARR
ncbi:hypothetical protein [Aquiflexum sp.]|uniref:hypothetical protein n=1 Tax=Aquiflexum sp. TaxID=1872584 RepID=UPI0035938BD5